MEPPPIFFVNLLEIILGGWVLRRQIILQGFSVFVNIILKRFLTTAPSDSFF